MPPTDPRGVLLRAFDAHAAAFAASGDTACLARLAAALAANLADWGERLDRLEVGRRAPFDPGRAAALVLESVFDEALTPDAWRVLAAAIGLVASPA
ncbi:MAG: hypothetical protein M3T55_02490 [Pseudomonadota bacterium]|nr:hypothetical protein [Pseudomonadota bacterium]